MKKSLIILIILILILTTAIIIENTYMNNPTNNERTNAKIAVQKEINIMFAQAEYSAPNNLDKPSLVIAKKGDKIIWQQELASTEIDPNPEKDVQLLDYFVTAIRIKKFQSQDALYVTLGNDINAKTYILNLSNGELLNLIIISPPPAR